MPAILVDKETDQHGDDPVLINGTGNPLEPEDSAHPNTYRPYHLLAGQQKLFQLDVT